MKRILEFIIFIFYRYYDKGSTKIIAYESALIGITLLAFLNVFAILVFFDVNIDKIFPIIETHGRVVKYLSSVVLWLPIYLIFRYFFKKDDIINQEVSKKAILFGNIGLIIYIVISVILLVIAIRSRT